MNTYSQDHEQNIAPDEALSASERDEQARNGIPCGECDGSGKKFIIGHIASVLVDCPVCFGLGRIFEEEGKEWPGLI